MVDDTEWSGVAKEEKESGGQTLVIFAICLAFVYLLLAAQYESFIASASSHPVASGGCVRLVLLAVRGRSGE